MLTHCHAVRKLRVRSREFPEDDMMPNGYACLGFLAGFHRNCTNKNVLVDNKLST